MKIEAVVLVQGARHQPYPCALTACMMFGRPWCTLVKNARGKTLEDQCEAAFNRNPRCHFLSIRGRGRNLDLS